MSCNCHSYNKDNPNSGKDSEVILDLPDFLATEERKTVCVDCCISGTIEWLWENKIGTLSSCCGHNQRPPSVVIKSNCDKEQAERIRNIISLVDDRYFELLSWKLTAV